MANPLEILMGISSLGSMGNSFLNTGLSAVPLISQWMTQQRLANSPELNQYTDYLRDTFLTANDQNIYGNPYDAFGGMFGMDANGNPISVGQARAGYTGDLLNGQSPQAAALQNLTQMAQQQGPGLTDTAAGMRGLLGGAPYAGPTGQVGPDMSQFQTPQITQFTPPTTTATPAPSSPAGGAGGAGGADGGPKLQLEAAPGKATVGSQTPTVPVTPLGSGSTTGPLDQLGQLFDRFFGNRGNGGEGGGEGGGGGGAPAPQPRQPSPWDSTLAMATGQAPGGMGMGGNAGIQTARMGRMGRGAVPFVGSFATGTPYVPQTGMAQVHQGEAIIPANQNPVNNVQGYLNSNGPYNDQTVQSMMRRGQDQIDSAFSGSQRRLRDMAGAGQLSSGAYMGNVQQGEMDRLKQLAGYARDVNIRAAEANQADLANRAQFQFGANTALADRDFAQQQFGQQVYNQNLGNAYNWLNASTGLANAGNQQNMGYLDSLLGQAQGGSQFPVSFLQSAIQAQLAQLVGPGALGLQFG